ncbi:CAP domain-containing protein [Rossellomorea yichunensis]|uniref:CAP domain-containing protein n=1 Tax=Rossellomorea yichunensis TaxID=3077331 RepID=UPI0028DF95C2|nr:CAP domain-containing protein [Rossellomorea sp. YC4-1]MDT9024523.1 CAP domain-containing protein [Rossellomorea sp. YC4-1]
MNKKMMISTATAFTLLAAPFAAGKADAAAPCPTDKVAQQVNAFKYSGNQEDLNKFVQDTLAKYQIEGKNINVQELLNGQTPKAQTAPAPAKEAPKAEAPAPAPKEEAPKAEAPAPAPKEEAPKAEAPAPAPAPAANEQQQQPEQQASEETGQLSQYEQKVVELTNQERAKQGLPALKVDTELSKVAREKSRDMQANNYFSHDSPTYGSPFDMMKQFGIEYSSAGENIAMGQPTPEEVVQAWMDSDGHRKNILSSNYTHIGVGHVENGNYWTQQFIGK